eukprot:scaffold5368_cov206-Alexandrium_tamarense.AAC.14
MKSNSTITLTRSWIDFEKAPIIFRRLGSLDMERRGRNTRKLRKTEKLGTCGSNPRMLSSGKED